MTEAAGIADSTGSFRKPPLAELGRDLLRVGRLEVTGSLILPFACVAGFFCAASYQVWWAAVFFAIVQSFFTYASISHDLVHRTLGLPNWLNELLLSVIEALNFRSGHAFRVTHLNHHARFPDPSDIEGQAAAMPCWRALIEGLTAQPRYFVWAWQHCGGTGAARSWLAVEGVMVTVLIVACIVSYPSNPAPIAYASLILAGSWIFPFMTSFMPHRAHEKNPIRQTRLFRGSVIRCLTFNHLYHLEHHLYPQVPHHRWPQLAERLDPFFKEAGIPEVRLGK